MNNRQLKLAPVIRVRGEEIRAQSVDHAVSDTAWREG